MPFFPTETHTLQYVKSPDEALSLLKQITQESDSLATQRTHKVYIGRINQNSFALISSTPGIGAFAVLKGSLSPQGGRLDIEINKPFRILICIIAAFAAGVMLWHIITHFEPKSFALIVPALMFFVIGRFMVRRAFKTAANLALQPMHGIFLIREIRKPT